MPHASARPKLDLGQLAPNLHETCAEYCDDYRAKMEAAVRAGGAGIATAHEHARILDGLLGALFCASQAVSLARGVAPKGRVALVAVGGYGRGMVGLRSDVDLIFLCDDTSDGAIEELAQAVLYPLWDLGVDIGHAIRQKADALELAREDLRTATTLLDMRRVAGDAKLVEELRHEARRSVFSHGLPSFFEALASEQQKRHERFGLSLYLLEPEVKLGCGGLRDLQVARWAVQARYGGRDFSTAVEHGVLLAREQEELETAREFLWRVRNYLHLGSRRRQDRLTFEDQEEISVQLGFVDGVTLGVEQFMQAYYRHARVVEQLSHRLLQRLKPRDLRSPPPQRKLERGLMLFDTKLTFVDSSRLDTDPALALYFYAKVLSLGVAPYPFARDAIARHASEPTWCQRLRASAEAQRIFLELLHNPLKAPVKHSSIVRELHDTGLLLAMVPEFLPVTGRVQHDIYHVYTVDVHSVAAVDRLRAIMRGEYAEKLPLATRLAEEVDEPAPLTVGLLLHDIGKAHGKDHSVKGAVMAVPIAQRLLFTPDEVDHIVWLVREHLSLYHWATRRDLSDPTVVEEVASTVGTVSALRDLYLLTVADLSTTNEKAMTSWKARLLEELYLAVSDKLRGHSDSTPALVRATLQTLLSDEPDRESVEAFVASMPARYLQAASPPEMLAHARIVAGREGRPVHLEARGGPSAELAELVVVADDRPGLLADLAAVFSAHRLAVNAAQIYTREVEGGAAEAVDVFWVRAHGGTGDVIPEAKLERIRDDLDLLIRGEVSAGEVLAGRSIPPDWSRRHLPDVPNEVQVDNEASDRFTIIEVFTQDQPALLHRLARTLQQQGLSIGLSKIITEGERAADVFYVTDLDGAKLEDPERLHRLREAIMSRIGE